MSNIHALPIERSAPLLARDAATLAMHRRGIVTAAAATACAHIHLARPGCYAVRATFA